MKAIFTFLKIAFTWWNTTTLGTWWMTWSRGRLVGKDAAGNCYYEERAPRRGAKRRRWVIYNGLVEASRVPSEWHAWLHHMVDTPPSEAPPARKAWEKDHQPNLTGTSGAYRPPGSLGAEAERPKATGDYEPWDPNGDPDAAGKTPEKV